jgi:general secretion pathway protein I
MVKLRSAGFTIVEVLIALALFAIVVPLFTVGITNLTAINNRARDLSLANMVAQNKIEILRSAGFNSLSDGTVDFSGELPSTLADPKSANYVISSPATGIKQVAVTISYKDYQTTQTVEYETFISELGVGQ